MIGRAGQRVEFSGPGGSGPAGPTNISQQSGVPVLVAGLIVAQAEQGFWGHDGVHGVLLL